MTQSISYTFFSSNLDCNGGDEIIWGFFPENFLEKKTLAGAKITQFHLAVAAKLKMLKFQSFWDKLTQQFRNILF